MRKLKTLIIVSLLIAVSLPVLAADRPYQAVLKDLSSARSTVKAKIIKWKTSDVEDPNIMDPNYEPTGWKTVSVNYMWKPSVTKWFRSTYKIPETINGKSVKGSKVVFHLEMVPRGEIFINGKLGGFFGTPAGDALLTTNAVPGEEYVIVLRSDENNYYVQGILFEAFVKYSAFDELEQRTNKYVDETQTVEALAPLTPNPEYWFAKLDESAALIDMDAYKKLSDPKQFGDAEKKYNDSVDAAVKVLEPFKEVGKKYSVYLLGYSHIDLAWRWDKHEGEDVWRNTTDTVLNLMNEYPEFTYNAGQAVGYAFMENDYPSLFQGIKKRVADGRWEVVGGAWVEHDGNVPSGEAYVRQYLYGQRYFQSRYGKNITVGWTPDSFGYNLGLPQILRRSGIKSFLTQKLNSNDTTKFPYNIFWWEGPDGSRILTYFPVGGYSENNDSKSMLDQLKKVNETHGVPENFVIFGVGDHGGAVTRTHLNRAFALKSDPIFPNVIFTTADQYFAHLISLSKTHDFPTWKDELYLEHHRGTYTTQSDTKRNNRLGEILQEESEKFASLATVLNGTPYPAARIREGWNLLLYNQFHDILPGSSINSVYKDSAQEYAREQQILNGVIDESLASIESRINTSGKGTPIVIYNPLSWKRDAPVDIEWSYTFPANPVVTDDRGRAVPSQFTSVHYPDKTLSFIARDIPAGGYAVYRIQPNPAKAAAEAEPVKSPDTAIENAAFRVAYDPASGAITSIFDKKSGRELITPGGKANYLQLFDDRPGSADAWEIVLGDAIPLKMTAPPRIVESGPVRTTFKFTSGTEKSTFTQYVTIYNGLPYIEFRIDADWREDHVAAKLAFDLNLKSETAWYDIPYAAIERRTVPRTDAERAKHEVSGQKWVDYTDPSANFGISLLNNGKYGFDIKGNIMRMTLLRAPTDPDPVADRGFHTFNYALYPHNGDWRVAAIPQRGYDYNYPPVVRIAESHTGKLPVSKSFFSSSPSNVLLTAIKKAEDDSDSVIRLYEASGKNTTATITLPAPVASAVETNLIEQKPDWTPAKIKISGNTITLPISHDEIKTLKIKYKK